jgi:hypothetical protein
MNRISSRRLSRLDQLAVAEGRRREAWLEQVARDHATRLTTLVLYGDPKIEEPLATAWDRALSNLGLAGVSNKYLPDRLRHVVIGKESETEKFAAVLCSAPAWLRYFCLASLDGHVLRFPLPTQSEMSPECGRDGLRDMSSWPDLPAGTIGAGRPIPKTSAFDALSAQELIDLIRLLKSSEDSWSRRDRRCHKEIMSRIDSDELSRAYLMLPESIKVDWTLPRPMRCPDQCP